jgi:Rieske Fe-S protein
MDPLISLPPAVEGLITMRLSEFPQLQGVGTGLVGRAAGVSDPIGIVHDEATGFFAVVATCTHMACPLRINTLNATLDCSCHGSSFELDGRVINGPATEPLRKLPVEFDGQLVSIRTK